MVPNGVTWLLPKLKLPVSIRLAAGVGWAGNGAWPAGGTLPNTAAPGLLPKASKLAKPPGEGVWPPKAGNGAKAGAAWGAAKGSPPMSASRSVVAFFTAEWAGSWELRA